MKAGGNRHSNPSSGSTPPGKPAQAEALYRSVMARAEALSVIFKMLGNPNRLRIIFFLHAQERTVSETERVLKIRQPTLSQQLGELRAAGLILRRRVAKSAIYALTPKGGDLAVRLTQALQGLGSAPVISASSTPVVRKSLPAAMFATVRPLANAAAAPREPTS